MFLGMHSACMALPRLCSQASLLLPHHDSSHLAAFLPCGDPLLRDSRRLFPARRQMILNRRLFGHHALQPALRQGTQPCVLRNVNKQRGMVV